MCMRKGEERETEREREGERDVVSPKVISPLSLFELLSQPFIHLVITPLCVLRAVS